MKIVIMIHLIKKKGKNSKPKRKTKKPTDPNGPKKSQTSFFSI